jgi:hypothetical protein
MAGAVQPGRWTGTGVQHRFWALAEIATAFSPHLRQFG